MANAPAQQTAAAILLVARPSRDAGATGATWWRASNLPNMGSPARRRVDVYAEAVCGLLAANATPKIWLVDADTRAKSLEFIDTHAALCPKVPHDNLRPR